MIIILGGGYVVIWIKVNNLGLWFLYCYIEFYVIYGMGLLFNELFVNVLKVFLGFLICSNFEKVFFVNVDLKEIKVFVVDIFFLGI